MAGTSLRGLWTGTLQVGLVTVPVKLAKATDEKSVAFNQFTEDGQPVGRVECLKNRVDDEPVRVLARADVKRGRQVGEQVVFVSDEELDALRPEASKVIAIEEFVDATDISLRAIKQAHLVVPDKGAEAGYAVLAEALAHTGKVGVGKWVNRQKEHLVALSAEEGVLVITTLFYADEMRPTEAVGTLKAADPKLLPLAVALIESLATLWTPEKYRDGQREAIENLIESKVKGEAVPAEEVDEPKKSTVDLVAALEQSLAAFKAAE